MIITVKIKTNSRKNSIILIGENQLKIHINAPAIDGKANKALIKYLSKSLKIPQSFINIKKGFTNSNKILSIDIEEGKWKDFKSKLTNQTKLC